MINPTQRGQVNNLSMGPGQSRPRRLLLCLDGVPYYLIAAAKQRGLFERFNSPSHLLSPFPTMTNIALSAMLGASVPLGYETIYFDRTEREIRGGIGKYLGRRTAAKMPSTYMDQLDYQEPLPFEYLVYFAPEKIWRADMRRFREQFRTAPQNRDYFAFLKGTDGLLHIRGAEPLEAALLFLDELLCEIQDWCGAETEIVMFSDHGMNVQKTERINLQTHLRRSGFKLSRSLRDNDSQSVALPTFGLIGFAALYCADSAAESVAEALMPLEGIDLALYRESETAVNVRSRSGKARIHLQDNGGIRYRYEIVDGDPLQLGPIQQQMVQDDVISADGYASDAEWAKRIGGHIYPDALANLYSSLQPTRVCHPADVLVSLEDGYYYGWSAFEIVVSMMATHGNAKRTSTNAFMMSTHRNLPGYVRVGEAQALLRN